MVSSKPWSDSGDGALAAFDVGGCLTQQLGHFLQTAKMALSFVPTK
jgi:hypothetical protein